MILGDLKLNLILYRKLKLLVLKLQREKQRK